MPRITNTTRSDLVSDTGLVIAARSSVELGAEDARALTKSKSSVIAHWFETGALTTDAPEEALQGSATMPSGNTTDPSDVTTLNEEELRAFLTSKDVKVDQRWGRDRLLQEALKVQPKV